MKTQPLFEMTDYLSSSAAALRLGVTRARVLQLMNEGKLAHVLVAGRRVPLRSEVERLIEARRPAAATN